MHYRLLGVGEKEGGGGGVEVWAPVSSLTVHTGFLLNRAITLGELVHSCRSVALVCMSRRYVVSVSFMVLKFPATQNICVCNCFLRK